MLERHILNKYRAARKKEGIKELLLLRVSLPTLRNPVTDLFHESLTVQYGLNEVRAESRLCDLLSPLP